MTAEMTGHEAGWRNRERGTYRALYGQVAGRVCAWRQADPSDSAPCSRGLPVVSGASYQADFL